MIPVAIIKIRHKLATVRYELSGAHRIAIVNQTDLIYGDKVIYITDDTLKNSTKLGNFDIPQGTPSRMAIRRTLIDNGILDKDKREREKLYKKKNDKRSASKRHKVVKG